MSDPVYHHLNDYGTNSIVFVIGTVKKGKISDSDGNEKNADVLNIGLTLDEITNKIKKPTISKNIFISNLHHNKNSNKTNNIPNKLFKK